MSYLNYNKYYFIGIGGIGMSAVAEYIHSIGKNVSGYDRDNSLITKRLIKLGIDISHKDDTEIIDFDLVNNSNTLVVYTPAISNKNCILNYFKKNNYNVVKRSDLLAEIVNSKFCIAIAGTHGKTTTTSILAHIMYSAGLNFTSFVGGVLKDYETNIILNGDEIFVVEADEYDKTFLKLHPNVASIMNIDGDHYDIYSDFNDLKKSFKKFSDNLKKDGILFHDSNLDFNGFTFGLNSDSDAQLINIKNVSGKLTFDIKINEKIYKDIIFNMLGTHNALNALVAFIIALNLNINIDTILKALKSFPGIKRRFSLELIKPKVFIDDYDSQLSMRAESVFKLDVAREKYSKYLKIVLSSDHVSKEKIYNIKEIISNNNSGKTKVILSYKNRDVIVPVSSKEDIYVKINDKLLSEIRSIAGNENVEIKYQ